MPQYRAITEIRDRAFAHTVMGQEQTAVSRVFSSSLAVMWTHFVFVELWILIFHG